MQVVNATRTYITLLEQRQNTQNLNLKVEAAIRIPVVAQ